MLKGTGMKKLAVVSVIVLGIGYSSLFTVLLVMECISGATYGFLLSTLALICIVLLVLPRLRELDLRNLRLVLAEIKQVKEDVAEMYGGIDNMRKQPLVLDKAKMNELGLNGGSVAFAGPSMRYLTGCMKRERERLARIFTNEKTPEKVAEAILDNSLDDKVFKWNGPESTLDAEPKSLEKRKQEKAAKEKDA